MILCGNPAASYQAHRADIDSAVRRVFDSERYILGTEVDAFEEEFASYLGARHAIGVGNGTDAITLALRACNIGPGDEVITVSHTASATAAAILLAGATPVLVDIDPNAYTLDPAKLPEALTDKTKAIIPVHLYGQAADMDSILAFAKQHTLRVIEDCAQATGGKLNGQKLGTFGDVGCFSFYPTKNLGAYGDGGMIVTSDAALAERVRRLRQYGWDESGESREPGANSRLDELQAAILRAKLPHLDADNAKRTEVANRYFQTLEKSGLQLPAVQPSGSHVFHLYVIRSSRRDKLLAHLRANDIYALVHYPVPAHLQPAYKMYASGVGSLPETEQAANEVLSLPIYPELTLEEQAAVIDAVLSFGETGND
jgi:dTDP-4-amino-4,6-dideoxygalactose transaminase